MLFKDYVAWLNQLLKERPELWGAKAVYAIDDEWNSFHEVHCNGTVWVFDDSFSDFIEEQDNPIQRSNAVCIN